MPYFRELLYGQGVIMAKEKHKLLQYFGLLHMPLHFDLPNLFMETFLTIIFVTKILQQCRRPQERPAITYLVKYVLLSY